MTMREELRTWIQTRFPQPIVTELTGDASTRRFFRVSPAEGGEAVILMDYGAPFDGESDDQRLTAIFLKGGLPVPRILEAAPDAGCLLLEDLGDRMLEDEFEAAKDKGETPKLWLLAAQLAGRIAREGSKALADSDRRQGPTLDAERFRFEMRFFIENFVEKHRKIRGDHGVLRGLLGKLAAEAARTPRLVLCHRDFHSRNLMVRPGPNLAMVDIQDARWGPDTYDLASLIFDAYVELDETWFESLIGRYLDTAGIDDDADLRHRFHVVAAERMIKALGTFGHQLEVVGNTRYVDAMSRTLRRLDRLLPRNKETSAIHDAFHALDLFEPHP